MGNAFRWNNMGGRAYINGTLTIVEGRCCFSETIMGNCIATVEPCEAPYYPVYMRAAEGTPILLLGPDQFEISNAELTRYAHSAQACVDQVDLPDVVAVAPASAFLTVIFFFGLMVGIFAIFASKWVRGRFDSAYQKKFVTMANNPTV